MRAASKIHCNVFSPFPNPLLGKKRMAAEKISASETTDNHNDDGTSKDNNKSSKSSSVGPNNVTSTNGAAASITQQQEQSSSSRRRVTFHASAKTADGSGDPFGVSIPRRIKLGKGGTATPLRDAFFLLALVGMLMYFAITIDVGPTSNRKPRKKDRIAIADQMNKMQKAMETMIMESVEKTRRKEGCDLFTAKGSIPETGLGVFAGRRFLKGEVIYDTVFTVPIVMPDGSTREVSPLSFLIKFHPYLSNVENTNTLETMKLKTTRALKAGDELFLPYEQHPLYLLALQHRNLFGNIPLASDYEMAELLQKDVANTARRMEVAHQRRVQDAVRLNTGYLYSLGATISKRFAPNAAKLLPASRTELHDRKDLPLAFAMLRNQTLANLQIGGSCLGDAAYQSSEENESGAVVATRSVVKGATLQNVPVHVFQSKKAHMKCLFSAELHWSVCPLTDVAILQMESSSESNVALKWTDENAVKDFIRTGMEETPAGSLSLELVATTSIEKGQRVSANDIKMFSFVSRVFL